ncbi:MAG: shikimate dehydrogenase [Coriobacteriales bacterium]|jgi:shikimate 5-dehydrogenase|nr:shikimate dehydrogenase [Coriobacteriales bacterium]
MKAGLLGYPISHSLSPAIHRAAYAALGLDWEYALYPCADQAAFLRVITEAKREPGAFVGFNVTTPYKVAAWEVCSEHAPSCAVLGNANVLTFFREAPIYSLRPTWRPFSRLTALNDSSISPASPAVVRLARRENDSPSGAQAINRHFPADAACGKPRLRGDNTDGCGLVASLEHEAGVAVTASSVVLCGMGPVALSTLLALIERKAASVIIVSRDPDRARMQLRDFCARLNGAFSLPTMRVVGYGEVVESLAVADILIDATSVGMDPTDGPVVPLEALRPELTVLDVVYGHGETALIRGAREVGARAIDGLGMLVEQAALTVELWALEQGRCVEAPREAMRQAALDRLAS